MHAVHYFYPLNRLSNHCTWKRNQTETRRSVCWTPMVLASRVSGYCKSSDLTVLCCSVFEIKPASAPMMRFWKKSFTARFVVLTGAGILCTTLKLANEEWTECILICFQVWYCFCKWLGLHFLANQYASKPSWYRFVEVSVSNPVDLVFDFVGWLGAENMKRHWDDWNQHVKCFNVLLYCYFVIWGASHLLDEDVWSGVAQSLESGSLALALWCQVRGYLGTIFKRFIHMSIFSQALSGAMYSSACISSVSDEIDRHPTFCSFAAHGHTGAWFSLPKDTLVQPDTRLLGTLELCAGLWGCVLCYIVMPSPPGTDSRAWHEKEGTNRAKHHVTADCICW